MQSAPATLVADPPAVLTIDNSIKAIKQKIHERKLTIEDLRKATGPANLKDPTGSPGVLHCPSTSREKTKAPHPEVVILHISEWTAGKSTLAGGQSDWYVFQKKSGKNDDTTCVLANVPTTASSEDAPLLYGVRGAILIAFDRIAPGIPGSMLYKFWVVPEKKENIQNLGALFAAVTGAAIGGAPPVAPQTEWFVTVARLAGYKHLPFDFNISSVFAPPTQSGPGTTLNPGVAAIGLTTMPSAVAGQTYNQQLLFTGGVGTKHFTALPNGSNGPPPGLSISPDGWLSGTPSMVTGGPVSFGAQIIDTDTPPKTFTQMYQITVNGSGATGGAPPSNTAGNNANSRPRSCPVSSNQTSSRIDL